MNQHLFFACNMACYIVFFTLTFLAWKNKSNKLFTKEGTTANPGMLTGLMIAGILWFGMIPAMLLNHSVFTFIFGKYPPGINPSIIFILLLVLMIIVAVHQSNHAFSKFAEGNKNLTLLSAAFVIQYLPARLLFLIVYETWFRGVFLFTCASCFGILAAVILNIALYTLLHVFNDKKEMWACLPFGILLCCVSCWFHAAWPAIVLHATFAMTYETIIISRSSIKLKTAL